VIEHLGGHVQRLCFAEAVHNLADRHWVQTPYGYFPIEPHWLFPGFQFLPPNVRQRLPLGVRLRTPSNGQAEGLHAALAVELLSRTEMSLYFPDSTLRFERTAGSVKSLIAIKS